MEQKDNKTTNNGTKQPDIDSDDYDPAKDPEVTDSTAEELMRWRNKLMPYQKYIMIVGITILIFLVVFLGYAYGGMKVCSELDGHLDSKFKCHPYIFNQTQTIDDDMLPKYIMAPNFTIED